MKLRNKKTGKIGRLYFDHQLIDPKTGTYAIVIQHRDKLGYEAFANYFTLAELNEEWEDYTPAEPLIKDEKIRKAVRAWAEACGVSKVMVAHPNVGTTTLASISNPYKISFSNERAFLPMGKEYSIDELCGEEE